MQFARQPACRFISLFNYIPLAERGQIHASKSHCASSAVSCIAIKITRSVPQPRFLGRVLNFPATIQRSFLAVANLAVEPRDNSGTGIQFFLPLLMPASAWAAIPRTNNPLQDCNSWLHRNEHTAFP
jgi:hypothetical protein